MSELKDKAKPLSEWLDVKMSFKDREEFYIKLSDAEQEINKTHDKYQDKLELYAIDIINLKKENKALIELLDNVIENTKYGSQTGYDIPHWLKTDILKHLNKDDVRIRKPNNSKST